MDAIAEIVTSSLPVFAVICLVGTALRKLRPVTSPLWAATLVAFGLLAIRMQERGYAERRWVAAVALAGWTGFAYLDWRTIHRPAPAAWPRRSVRIVLFVVVVTALVGLGVGSIARHQWLAQQR